MGPKDDYPWGKVLQLPPLLLSINLAVCGEPVSRCKVGNSLPGAWSEMGSAGWTSASQPPRWAQFYIALPK